MTFWCPALGFPCGGTGVPSSLRTEPGAFDGSKRGFRLFENCAMTGVQVLLTDGSVACRILTFERVLVVRRVSWLSSCHEPLLVLAITPLGVFKLCGFFALRIRAMRLPPLYPVEIFLILPFAGEWTIRYWLYLKIAFPRLIWLCGYIRILATAPPCRTSFLASLVFLFLGRLRYGLLFHRAVKLSELDS